MVFAIFPLAAFLLKFVRKKDGDPRMDERQEDPMYIDDLTRNDAEDRSPMVYRPLIAVTLTGHGDHEISWPSAIYRAFRSPIVKCIHYSVSLVTCSACFCEPSDVVTE